MELGIPVGVVGAFPELSVALQAVTPGAQQLADHRVSDLVAQFPQRRREPPQALRRPPQRPLGIAPRRKNPLGRRGRVGLLPLRANGGPESPPPLPQAPPLCELSLSRRPAPRTLAMGVPGE